MQNRKWNQLVKTAVMTCKVVAADSTCKFLLADRVRRKKSLCVYVVSLWKLFVIFHILQGHLKLAQSSAAGMCAVQSELNSVDLCPCPDCMWNTGSGCMFGHSKSAFALCLCNLCWKP